MKIFKPPYILLHLGLSIFWGACTSTSIEETELCDTSSISYAVDIVPIVTKYCSQDFDERNDRSCHGEAAPDGDWTNYSSLKLKAEDGSLVARAVLEGGGMPPSYSTGPLVLGQCEKIAIESWVDAGAPDN